MKILKESVKKAFHFLGFDLVRTNYIPQYNLMGLRNLPIYTIIDVGAYNGWFSQRLLEFFPQANIYCFEPLPNIYQELVSWTEKTGGKVTAYNVALGESEDIVTIHYNEDWSASSSLLSSTQLNKAFFPFTEKKIDIPVTQTTLDIWMENDNLRKNLKPEILIKLDVQGYEDRVIEGGKNLFKKAKACLLEINLVKLYQGQPSFGEIFRLFDEMGYYYSGNYDQVYDKDGRVIYIDALFVKGD